VASFFKRQAHIDARQSLGDDIMQLAADLLALFLLRRCRTWRDSSRNCSCICRDCSNNRL
jgi:hypothetical protein